MKRSQRPRAFTVRVVPNKSCHRHRRQLSPCACHRCSCHPKKNIFQALPAPLLAHKKPGLVSVWRRFCGEKPAIQGGHIKAHCASIIDTGLNLFCSSQSPYISTTRHIYIYMYINPKPEKKNTHVIFVLNAKGCPPKCERPIPLP